MCLIAHGKLHATASDDAQVISQHCSDLKVAGSHTKCNRKLAKTFNQTLFGGGGLMCDKIVDCI